MGRTDVNSIKERIEKIYYSSYRNLLCLYAERILGHREDAEDIVNDIFLKLWETRDQMRKTKSLLTYIYRSVRNNCLDFLKHRQVIHEYVKYLSNYSAIFHDRDDVHPLSLLLSEETVCAREQAIDVLPPRCKDIFILARIEGLSHQDIAEQLGITASTVKTQITIATNKLCQTLENFGIRKK